jgi:hypothetical protein
VGASTITISAGASAIASAFVVTFYYYCLYNYKCFFFVVSTIIVGASITMNAFVTIVISTIA